MRPHPGCSDILAFLENRGMLAGPVAILPALDQPVLGVARDANATRGDMSWIATRRAHALADILVEFQGALLICPPVNTPLPPTHAVIAPCTAPKEAFAEAV